MERTTWALLGVVLLACLSLVPFALLDQRPLNDHDPEFAGPIGPQALAWRDASPPDRMRMLQQRLFEHGERHPQLPQAALLAWTGTFGWSRASIRLSNLPWLVLLLLGTWLVARQAVEPRLAMLAVFLVSTLPVVQHMARKWFPHLHAAALAPVALGLLLVGLHAARERRAATWAWVGLGLVQGLRLHCHPIGVPDIALLTALGAGALGLARAERRAWLGLGGATALAALIGAPAVFAGALHEGAVGLPEYAEMMARYFSLGGEELRGFPTRLRQAVLPGAAVLLVLPGLAGLALPSPSPWVSVVTRLMALRVGLQIPLVLVTVSNSAFLSDWMLLAPDCVLLSLLGLQRLASALGRVGPLLLAGAAAQGAVTLLLPLGIGLAVPDILEPDALPSVATPYRFSEHGGAYNTHHIPLRAEQPGAALTRLLDATRPESIGITDLTWIAEECRMPPLEGRWHWGAPDPNFRTIPGSDPMEAGWQRTVTWRLGADTLPDGVPLVVRIWQAPNSHGPPCIRSLRDRADLRDGAAEVVRERFGLEPVPIDDRAQWLTAAARPREDANPEYIEAALLVPR